MTHQDSIQSIILSYADKVTEQDIWNTYNRVLANEAAITQGMKVLVQYAKENMATAKDILEFYLSDEFTSDNRADLFQIVDKLKHSNPDANVYGYAKDYLEGMVREYLEQHHYVQKTDCPSFNPCVGH